MRFLKGLARWVLLPIVVVSASILIAVIGWNYYQEYRDRELAIAKTWPPNQLPFGSDAILKTSWRRGMLHYQFSVKPISEDFMQKFQRRKDSDRGNFFLEFEDSSGFKLGKLQINLGNMTRIVDEKGDVQTVEIKDSTLFERDAYKNSSRLAVAWSDVFDEIAKEIEREKTNPVVVPAIKARKTPTTVESSFFTIGSTKDEVLRVQGQPTSVDNYTWWYGSSYVSFDASGKVSGWSGGGIKARLAKGAPR